MSYEQAYAIIKNYFEKSTFTLDVTEAFEVLLEKCAKDAADKTC
jgi:hypothetical protein